MEIQMTEALALKVCAMADAGNTIAEMGEGKKRFSFHLVTHLGHNFMVLVALGRPAVAVYLTEGEVGEIEKVSPGTLVNFLGVARELSQMFAEVAIKSMISGHPEAIKELTGGKASIEIVSSDTVFGGNGTIN